MSVPLIYIKDGSIKDIPIKDAIKEIYYLRYRIPTNKELKNTKLTVQEIKTMVSSNDDYIPLYDVFVSNIYLIQKRNVYIRVVKQNYRFPDEIIMNTIKELSNEKNIKKSKLIFEFIGQLDMKTMYEKYLDVFYRYSPIANLQTYTCMRKSFISHTEHLQPYYSKDEILKLGLNMGIIHISVPYIDYKDSLLTKDYQDICFKIQKNDISSKVLLEHQKHIIENDMDGLMLYYTIQGSYFMNRYLRSNTGYYNDYLEDNIIKVWKHVLEAPAFDNDYYLYRFIETDDHLSHLKIGDTYVEKGFTSTTRDPFYKIPLYQFGFILVKIKIPKNIKGVGLCLELISHFVQEEEIILPPLTNLKLVSKDDKCPYYHIDDEFENIVVKKYEFEWVKNSGKIIIDKRNILEKDTQVIDFLKIDLPKGKTLKDKADYFVNKYCDKMFRIKNIINDKTLYVIAEYYDSTGPYQHVYHSKVSNGFSLYTIYDKYVLFMIEIYEKDGINKIDVNYYRELSKSNIDEILGDENFIKYISSIAYYFDVPYATIYAEFSNCNKENTYQRGFKDNKYIKIEIDNDKYIGGRHCTDFYKYFKNGYKRYKNTNILSSELQPAFSYHLLDTLKNTSLEAILSERDRDEIYQIYKNTYNNNNNNNNNIADFYIWLVENKCYLIDLYIDKISFVFRDRDNPFYSPKYELDAMCYLYNRHYVKTYNRFIVLTNDEIVSQLKLPKNEYRITR